MVLTYREPVLSSSKLLPSDKKTRDAAVLDLRGFVVATAEKPMDKLEMAKLWKGIFYCSSIHLVHFVSLVNEKHRMPGFWMSDKPLVQQELSANLAELLLDVPTADASFDFLRGFWEAIVREWSGLDYLRLVWRRLGRSPIKLTLLLNVLSESTSTTC